MPQEHYVLRCISCETFQAHIVKKSKKWECKICGTKQSLKRNYGKGSGKDCRTQVMKLNELRLTQEEIVGDEEDINGTEDEFTNNYCEIKDQLHYLKPEVKNEDCGDYNNADDNNKPFKSKWDVFLEEDKESSDEDEDESEINFTWEVNSKKRKRSEHEVTTFKKKASNDFEHESDIKPKSVNTQKLNYTKSPKKMHSAQSASKWGMYLNSQDDSIDEESSKPGMLFGTQEDDDLDEILKL